MVTKISVDKYLDIDLLAALGLAALTPEERQTFLESFGAVIQQRLTMRLMQELDEKQKDGLETLLTNRPDDAAAFAAFLNAEVPDFKRIAEEEVAKYKKELLERQSAK